MKILDSIQELAGLKEPIVLAAGTFDGVHLGHQALIRRAMKEAETCGAIAVVMTFDRHPAALLRPEKAPKILTRNDDKIALLEGMGVQALLMLEFNLELASVPAREFIASLLSSCCPLRAICVGSQWSFGRGGEGNVELLKELGAKEKFSVIQIDPVKAEGGTISSTRIRTAIAAGDLDQASACFGRPFLLSGEVVTGAGLGSKIGFPTANLGIEGMQLPPNGVYAVKVLRGSEHHLGVCNIGLRPTVDSSASTPVVEAHLFNVTGNLVGEKLSLEFAKFLRPERKFTGIDELQAQIAKDSAEAKKVFSF